MRKINLPQKIDKKFYMFSIRANSRRSQLRRAWHFERVQLSLLLFHVHVDRFGFIWKSLFATFTTLPPL